ncbi:MAG: dolichyl-phosphate beta-glucosyltransferase [Chloroflexota bacterium]
MKSPYLSIVIPARNEESRLPRSLGQVFAFLEKQDYTGEVLVVENASTDHTLEAAQEFARHHPGLRVLHEDLPGKGRAVQRGMLEARGEFRFIADADLSMPIEQVNRFLPPACSSDIAIASREAPGAQRFDEPYYRHLTGRVFNFFIRSLVLPGLQDTQCGFKCFRAAAAEDLFRRQTLTGWSFDVELLAIARRRGYSIAEIGIPWTFDRGSKINVLRHSWRMFLDLLAIRRNLRRGVYDA